MAASESVGLCSTCFDYLIWLRAQEEGIYGKRLLSDRGVTLMTYGRRFLRHFHCIWHLLESYRTNKWFATYVRRIAFATCEDDFRDWRCERDWFSSDFPKFKSGF
jgi:hypothetical protein